jgi:hypothetical protein
VLALDHDVDRGPDEEGGGEVEDLVEDGEGDGQPQAAAVAPRVVQEAEQGMAAGAGLFDRA